MSGKTIILAALVAGGLLAAAKAHATDPGFERMTYREYRYLLRDAHLARQKRELERAFELSQRNACTGDKTSQFALGSMYLLGEGTKADGLKAYAWLKSAAEAQDPQYDAMFRKIATAIPAEHQAAADAAADDLIARYGLKASRQSCEMRPEPGTRISKLQCEPVIDPRTNYVEVRVCD